MNPEVKVGEDVREVHPGLKAMRRMCQVKKSLI